jgi:nicotinamide riboside kinase
VPEFAREYALRKGSELVESDVEPIARGQFASESRALLAGSHLIVFDTDLLSTAVYAEHYYGWCPEWVRRAARGRSGLYLLLDTDVPFVADPTRGPAARRAELHERFVRALTEAEVVHTVISGAWEERLERALRLIVT